MALAYTSISLDDVASEVIMRLGELRVGTNVSYGDIIRYVQESRRELASRVVPTKEHAFIKDVDVSDGALIPLDFIKPVRVILQNAGGEYVEARRVDPREWTNVVQAGSAHSFAQASTRSPVYMIWANGTQGSPAWAQSAMAIHLSPNTMTGKLEYVAFYADVDLDDETETVSVPAETEGLLIAMVLERALFRYGNASALQKLSLEVQSEFMAMRTRLGVAKITENVELEAKPEQQPVSVPSTVEQV
jgi:hypothetical protein